MTRYPRFASIEPCMCGALDCPSCRGLEARCATCDLDEDCPFDHDVGSCEAEREMCTAEARAE